MSTDQPISRPITNRLTDPSIKDFWQANVRYIWRRYKTVFKNNRNVSHYYGLNIVTFQVERVVTHITTARSTFNTTNFRLCKSKKFVAKSRTRFYFAQHFAAVQLATLKFVAWQVEHAVVLVRATFRSTCNTTEQRCTRSWTKMLPVLLGLKPLFSELSISQTRFEVLKVKESY